MKQQPTQQPVRPPTQRLEHPPTQRLEHPLTQQPVHPPTTIRSLQETLKNGSYRTAQRLALRDPAPFPPAIRSRAPEISPAAAPVTYCGKTRQPATPRN